MASTPVRIRELINRQQMQIAHVTDILKTKRTVSLENQADWVKEKSEDYFIGFANGINALLEDALSEHKCYAGFAYLGLPVRYADGTIQTPTVGPDHPDFAEWRRLYYTKGNK